MLNYYVYAPLFYVLPFLHTKLFKLCLDAGYYNQLLVPEMIFVHILHFVQFLLLFPHLRCHLQLYLQHFQAFCPLDLAVNIAVGVLHINQSIYCRYTLLYMF